jgi:hypothetical protein
MGTDCEAAILTEGLIALKDWGDGLRSRDRSSWWMKKFDDRHNQCFPFQMRHLGIPYEPREWVGEPLTSGERQAFARAAASLEALGLIIPVRQRGTRLSHFRLTPRGLQIAVVLNSDVDLQSVKKAIATTKWGTREHLRAVRVTRPTKPATRTSDSKGQTNEETTIHN